MQLRITRTTPETHTLEYIRKDGSSEKKETNTRSFLWHDFTHFVLESEAKLKGGFFGLMEQGYSFEELSAGIHDDDAKVVEMVVGPLSSVLEKGVDPKDYLAGMENMFNAHGEAVPSWLTPELVDRVIGRYRKIKGEWNSLAFGETLELTFDVS